MIVKMHKALLAVRAEHKDRLLTALRDLGVVHLTPVDPAKAQPDEKTVSAIGRLARTEQILAPMALAGEAPDLAPLAAADRVLELHARAAELRNRLAALALEADRLAMWGDVRLETFRQIREAGLEVRFFEVASRDIDEIPCLCRQVVGSIARRAIVAAVFAAGTQPELPESAKEIPLPPRDRPTVLAEARQVDEQLHAGVEELAHLAHLREGVRAERIHQEQDARYAVALRGGLTAGEELFAVQGWVPRDAAEGLRASLADVDLDAAVEFMDPAADDLPPTLVRYPRWVRPIKGLFDILGTVPGYREFDVSAFFMVALPIFAAMLIGDAVYGLVFVLLSLIFYRKGAAKAGREKMQLVVILGLAALIWGVMVGSYLCFSPDQIRQAGGVFEPVGGALARVNILQGMNDDEVRALLAQVSLIMGMIHLCLAKVRRVIAFAPDPKALAEVGWILFLVGVLGFVLYLFIDMQKSPTPPPRTVYFWLLGIGGALVVAFGYPSPNPAKRLGLGLATALLPTVGAVGDTFSYIRLMAVGIASGKIGGAFNDLAASAAPSGTWLLGGLLMVFGHGLNMALAPIALFSHGVRLNLLEFSNNVGMEWSGYTYEPFGAKAAEAG